MPETRQLHVGAIDASLLKRAKLLALRAECKLQHILESALRVGIQALERAQKQQQKEP